MPYQFQLKPPAYARILDQVQNAAYETPGPLECRAWVSDEPVGFADRETGVPQVLEIGQPCGKRVFDCARMSFSGRVPDSATGKTVVALVDFNGEGLVVGPSGEPQQGMTTVSSEFDTRYGIPVKRTVPLFQTASGGEKISFWVDAANNDLFGKVPNSGRQQARLAVQRPELLALGYDLEVLGDFLRVLDPRSARCQRLKAKLYDAACR